MVELYRDAGLALYEAVHYSHGEHRQEIAQILSWYRRRPPRRILDLGCSGGLHALELARSGYQVVGIDREYSAVALARSRVRESGLDAHFQLGDLACDPRCELGRFDLIYSIGNVLSHLPKAALPAALQRMRGCCAPDGMILFDLLMIGPSVPPFVGEEDLGILWKRRVDRASGRIELQGIFTRYGVTQDFLVWGYTVAEVVHLLIANGFSKIDYAPSLDFSGVNQDVGHAPCLKFRAQP